MKWVFKLIARNVTIIFISLLIILFNLYNYTYFRRIVEAMLLGPDSIPLVLLQAPGCMEVANEERYVGLENTSCLSRCESSKYRKPSPFEASSYLLSKIRNYEKLHKRCGPGTQPYNEALRLLELNHTTNSQQAAECNYVVYICLQYNCGLGNRILTTSAVFLYALLTDRVLLIDQGNHTQMMNMHDLFCEPFPSSSWFLPHNFPLNHDFEDFTWNHPNCHGNMLRNNVSQELSSYLYLHLSHEASHHDKLFFCDQQQTLVKNVPWLILRSNLYFVPSLYLIPSFKLELSRMFPNKETTFHHLGRYLFHPTNQVWELITSYYDTYFTNVDERIGIQMRLFGQDPDLALQVQLNQRLLSCISKESLLPEINKSFTSSSRNPLSMAVLITSLDPSYYENLRDLYREFQNVSTQATIAFYQPSREIEQSSDQMHERKALAEMYLLSLSDKLITSGRSTFGYVAQGLGGGGYGKSDAGGGVVGAAHMRRKREMVKEKIRVFKLYWVFLEREDEVEMGQHTKSAPEPIEKVKIDPSFPCRRAMSIEPCFHDPPSWDCKAKKAIDIGEFVPYIRQCEDITWGVKLVDDGQHKL